MNQKPDGYLQWADEMDRAASAVETMGDSSPHSLAVIDGNRAVASMLRKAADLERELAEAVEERDAIRVALPGIPCDQFIDGPSSRCDMLLGHWQQHCSKDGREWDSAHTANEKLRNALDKAAQDLVEAVRIIKAQDAFLVAYRVQGKTPAEKHFKVLEGKQAFLARHPEKS